MNEPIELEPGQKIIVKGKTYVLYINDTRLDIQHKPTAEIRQVNE